MPDTARKPATVEELMARVGGGDVYLELWNGELRRQVMPRLSHGRTAARIAAALTDFDDNGTWWIGVEIHWRVDAAHAVVIDVAGWLRERLPEVPEGAVPIRPDWACEVLTPGDAARDLVDKSALYSRLGVPWYWIVDAEEGVIECRQNVGVTWQVFGTWRRDQPARIPPFEGLELTLERLFLPRK